MNNILSKSILLFFLLSTTVFADSSSWFTKQNPLSLDCGPANVVMNIKWKYPNSDISINKIRKYQSYWSMHDIQRALNSYSVYSEFKYISKDNILYELNNNHNLIINVDMTRTPYSYRVGYGKNYLTPWFTWPHFLTISEYKYINNELFLVVQDSWTARGNDVLYRYSSIKRMIKYRYALSVMK